MTFTLNAYHDKALRKALTHIIPDLRSRRIKQPTGGMGLTTTTHFLEVEDIFALLANVFPFDESVITEDRTALISRAVFADIQNDEFDESTLIASLVQHYDKYLSVKFKRFTLLTYLSMNPIRGVPAQRDFDNCHFEFSAGIPNGFTRDNLKAPFSAMNIPLYTKEWTAVTVSCYGRNAQSSGNRALDTLNYLRAIWNFSYNRWQGYSWSAPVECPKNRIRIGPVHTVHNPDGTPAGDWFYFEQPFAQSYYPGRADAYGEKELNDLARQEEFYLSPIDKLKYRGEFRSVLREYVSILDTPSSEGGFTRLWKVLEALTATEMADYDTMVTRASAVFRNTQLAHMMVNQLKHARNITTHDMKSAIDSRICFQQALRFVHALLVLHLDYAGEFASFKEVGEFLSLVAAGKDRIAHGRKLSGLAGEVIGQRETWNLSHDYTI